MHGGASDAPSVPLSSRLADTQKLLGELLGTQFIHCLLEGQWRNRAASPRALLEPAARKTSRFVYARGMTAHMDVTHPSHGNT